ncbi:Vesicle transport v-SNARE [Trypanosoma melophagium]|uniref:Vesicle transport v-SNARE n=1 Tax=Trypanosoma melophagium TaxID=715481 RepID=UPI003519FF35|nr:Vesicle transport v-SNARE [Trypanosoma melophagium]
MSTLFQSYEEEYRDVVKNIRDGISELRATLHRGAADGRQNNHNAAAPAVPATGPGSRLQRGSHLATLMAQVKELLNNMEYECNDVAVEQRPLLKERLVDFRKNARGLEEEIAKLRAECAAADREDLMGATAKKGTAAETAAGTSSALGLDDETARHRLQMMQNTQRVKQASNTLLRAEKLLNETEETGAAALGNLRTQTETLHRINVTTIEVNEEISEARKILTRMHRTMVKHKLMLVGIILMLLFLIFVALYVSVSRNERQKQVQPTQNSTDAPSLPSWSPGSGGGVPTE